MFMNRKSMLLGLAVGGVLILAQLAVRHFQARPAPLETRPLPPASAYVSTPERDALLNRYIGDVLTFSTLHETGHMLISVNHMPRPEHEEDEVDRFAVMVMSKNRGRMHHDALLSAAEFWSAIHRLGGGRPYDRRAKHSEPQVRADEIVCLMYGEDPKRYADMAEDMKMSEGRRSECRDKARQNSSRWGGVLASNLNTELYYNLGIQEPGIAVVYEPVPNGLSESWAASFAHARTLLTDASVLDVVAGQLVQLRLPYKMVGRMQITTRSLHPGVNHPEAGADLGEYDYVVRADACLDKTGNPEINAYWNSENHTMTLCYALVNVIENTGRSVIAEAVAKNFVR
jgi:hypothetical protein